jgi:DNA helicase-2/ATP-dependent DNA helicase PcrA
MRYRFGDLNSSTPSRFIEEIDQNLLELRKPSIGGATATSFFSERRSNLNSARKTTLHRVRGSSYLSGRDGHKTEHQEDGVIASQEINSLSTGMIVYHDSFGRGRIVNISGEGENARAVVNFDEVGRKLLLLKYAHLRIEEE